MRTIDEIAVKPSKANKLARGENIGVSAFYHMWPLACAVCDQWRDERYVTSADICSALSRSLNTGITDSP